MRNTSAERPTITAEGERVALGPLRRDLAPTYQRWHNDVATARTYALPLPTTLEQEELLVAEMTADQRSVFFTIHERASREPVGMAYLTDIDHRNRRAEFGILIGEPGQRGKGYGSEATALVLGFAFSALGLHNVMLTVYAYNLAGRRAYEKAGFREFARLREHHWMGGRWWDEVWMECLATEFAGPEIGNGVRLDIG